MKALKQLVGIKRDATWFDVGMMTAFLLPCLAATHWLLLKINEVHYNIYGEPYEAPATKFINALGYLIYTLAAIFWLSVLIPALANSQGKSTEAGELATNRPVTMPDIYSEERPLEEKAQITESTTNFHSGAGGAGQKRISRKM